MTFEVTRLDPADLLALEVQDSQQMLFGAPLDCDEAQAEALAREACAWTCRADGRVIACFGINETFPGLQGVGWALLGRDLGRWHLPVTRAVRSRALDNSPLKRIEVFARCHDIEPVVALLPDADSGALVAAAMAEPTPECRWCLALGLNPAHVLRQFGGASEPVMLFERIRA